MKVHVSTGAVDESAQVLLTNSWMFTLATVCVGLPPVLSQPASKAMLTARASAMVRGAHCGARSANVTKTAGSWKTHSW